MLEETPSKRKKLLLLSSVGSAADLSAYESSRLSRQLAGRLAPCNAAFSQSNPAVIPCRGGFGGLLCSAFASQIELV